MSEIQPAPLAEPTVETRTTTVPPLEAVLWDFDGTLADSEVLWMEAQFELIPQWGGDWNHERAERLVGNSLIDSGRIIVETINRPDLDPAWVMDRMSDRVTEKLASGPIPWRPGALELLGELRRAQVPCALVSASYRVMLDVVVSRLPAGTFDVVVAGDEVTRGKPDPEPYLTAARRLGVDPRNCVVLEDSVPGATSGNAAGAVVVAVRNLVDIGDAPRRVHRDTLVGLTPAELAALVVAENEAA